MRIVISGMVAGDADQGGASWAVLQYVLGFQRLGHDVLLIEPVTHPGPRAVATFHRIARAFGLHGRAALLSGEDTVGMPYPDLTRAVRGADLLVNVSGMLRDPELTAPIPVRAYLDLDPAFNQLWQEAEGIDVGLGGHTHHLTVGRALAEPGCRIPTCGCEWVPVVPPVVLERWPVAERIVHDAWTTVANWRAYGSIEYHGIRYGQKAHSLRALAELPLRVPDRIALALSIDPAERPDLELLAANRWELLDPRRVAGTPAAYADFVRGSKGEIGIAKSGYVTSRSGWFSDRSACYLSSGRPVVAQDTGFGSFLPVGAGLMSFTTTDEACAAIEAVRSDYGRHARAARAVAEEYFDSDRVLTHLLQAVGLAPVTGRRRATDASDAEIVEALAPLRVERLRRRPFVSRSTFPLLALDVTTAAGDVRELLLKDLSGASVPESARRAKPSFLYDPLREIETYRRTFEGGEPLAPGYHGCVVDSARGRYWLVLERLRGVELFQIGELETWVGVARSLARLHDRHRATPPHPHLVDYDAAFLTRWLDRARSFGRLAELGCHPFVVERLTSLPRTLVHGELYPSNVLIDGDRVCVIDWETSGTGPGVIDLAALITGWTDAAAQEMVDAYRTELAHPPDPAEFALDLTCARLHLAVRWLGWARDFSPPPEHARDWAADVDRLERSLHEARAVTSAPRPSGGS